MLGSGEPRHRKSRADSSSIPPQSLEPVRIACRIELLKRFWFRLADGVSAEKRRSLRLGYIENFFGGSARLGTLEAAGIANGAACAVFTDFGVDLKDLHSACIQLAICVYQFLGKSSQLDATDGGLHVALRWITLQVWRGNQGQYLLENRLKGRKSSNLIY
jgi:hypothetical protein